MEKYVSFGMREEIIDCDIDITYERFLGKMKENAFSVNDLTEDNFGEMMIIKNRFNIERERLSTKDHFIE